MNVYFVYIAHCVCVCVSLAQREGTYLIIQQITKWIL